MVNGNLHKYILSQLHQHVIHIRLGDSCTTCFNGRHLREVLQNIQILAYGEVNYPAHITSSKLTENRSIDFLLQGSHREWDNDLVLTKYMFNRLHSRREVKTLGGS